MKKQSNKGSLLGHLLSPITMGFSRSKQRSKQVSQEMLTRRTTTSLNEKSLSINSDGNDTAQDDDDVIVEESRITSIKKFHRTETSEGISCAALSLHTGSFPSCPGGATKNLDDEILVVPLVIESSKKQRLAHQVSALSDVPVEGEQPGVVCSPCSSTGEATSVETLVKSINELWLQDPSLVIGNNDAAQCREVMETLLADKEQLHRILVARKYTINLSTNLFFEQLRFRTRWEPENIGPQDIPNALPCKLFLYV